MSRPYISVQLAADIFVDAGHRCGYCRSDERLTGSALSLEHLTPISAGGPTVRSNLWRSCRDCNERKGALVRVVDPETSEIVELFNPRTQRWSDHFAWSSSNLEIIGRTAVGRATVVALDLNRPLLTVARQQWVILGLHPPPPD